MAFTLIPREIKFFDLFDQAAAIVDRISERFLKLILEFDRLPERGNEIREDRYACGEVLQKTIEAAEQSFVTPFDRESIHSLIQAVNDLVDAVHESAGRFEVFRIDRPTQEAVAFTRILHDCCHHLAESLRLCRDWKNVASIRNHAPT